jgi:hypothetical protein
MFWLGQLLVVISGLLGLGFARAWILKHPKASETHIDLVLLLCLAMGVALAVREYLGSESDVRSLELKISEVRDYSDISQLTINGSPIIEGDIKISSPLTRILEGTFQISGGVARRICSPEAIAKNKEAISYNPRFPFSYYWMALCLKDAGDPTWVESARKAVEIFQITTQISGHHPSHDECLRKLREFLAEERVR